MRQLEAEDDVIATCAPSVNDDCGCRFLSSSEGKQFGLWESAFSRCGTVFSLPEEREMY
jgi:hypothetical protein